MKRHPALQELSRDHHHLLLQARELRWALEEPQRGRTLAEVLPAFLQWWELEGPLHLREEEEILLPVYARFPSDQQQQNDRQIRQDHRWLREHIARLRQQEATPRALAARVQRRLHDHVRFEERFLFEHLQRVAPEAALQELAALSRAFRRTWRPHAIGPR